jgi:NAD+ diphosphatase
VTGTPVLSRSEHDRIAHRRGDIEWLDAQWQKSTSRVLVLSATGKAAVREDALVLIEPAAVTVSGLRVLLGEFDSRAYFGLLAEEDVSQPDWANLRESAVRLSALDSGLLTAAVALREWHASHSHCPRCGGQTEPILAGWARRCANDGSHHFPRTDPAVIMLITDDTGRCLLGRASAWPPGRFSTLAGFVEAGESAEAAVAREVVEEVGVLVTDIRYFASQPHPFPGSLMLGFTARLDGDPTLRLDDDEIVEAGWFTREDVRRAVDWDAVTSDAVTSDAVTSPAGGPAAAGSAAGESADRGSILRALPPAMSIARQLIENWLAADHTASAGRPGSS